MPFAENIRGLRTPAAGRWLMGAASACLLLTLAGCKEATGLGSDGVHSFSISATAFNLDVGQSVALTATTASIEGGPATPAGMEWSSSNALVAGVDGSGRVTAIGPGRATVSVRAGRHIDSATVRVGVRETDASPTWATVHAGPGFTCALDTSGERFCWGENPFGAHGNNIRRLHTVTYSPVATGDPLRYSALSSGSFHGCGLALSGAAYCWGNNAGQQASYALVPNRMDLPSGLREIRSGAEHTCALDAQGFTYCWGSNLVGALGNPAAATRQVAPLRVAGSTAFAVLSTGFAHTCGLRDTGEAFCWGTAMAGELGEGSPATTRVQPHAVSGGLRFASISAGNAATCALTPEGVGYCWGVITISGPGGPRRGETAVPVRLETELRFAQLEVGSGHTCGRTTGGEVFCWGLNEFGQAGVEPALGGSCTSAYVSGNVPCAATPNRVSAGLRFRQISVGRHHTCGVTVDSALYCWGRNDRGQLGTGRMGAYFAQPVRVAPALR